MLSPECQAFYDETVKLRKELSDKRYEYFEALRNPKTTGRMINDLDEELWACRTRFFLKPRSAANGKKTGISRRQGAT